MSTRQFLFPALAVAILAGAGLILFTRGPSPRTRTTPVAEVPRDSGPAEIAKPAKTSAVEAETRTLAKPAKPAAVVEPTQEPAAVPQPMKRYKFESTAKAPDEPAVPAAPSQAAARTTKPLAPGGASEPENDLVFVSRADVVRARNASYEAAAITTLRSVCSAQAMAVTSAVIDTDGDGAGEYAFFGELSGSVPCRAARGGRGARMRPPVLSTIFGEVTAAGNVLRSGYAFRLYLPGPTARDRRVPGIAESAGGGSAADAPRTDSDNCEVLWALYAWPIEAPSAGARAFFVNQEGDLLVTANADGRYSGEDRAPRFDAAFSSTTPGDMSALPVLGSCGNDGQVWSLLDAAETAVEPPVELGPATAADLALNEDPKSERVVVSRTLMRSATIAGNESHAIHTLRTLWSAEAQIQAAGAIDTDDDSTGEYAFLGEMAGTVPCRAAAGSKPERLEPALLDASFGKLTSAGHLLRSGYVFRIGLPGKAASGKVPAVTETAGAGVPLGGARPDHDHCEVLWNLYAWPIEPGKTGARAFFMNQDGDLYWTPNADGAYGGEAHAPAFDAAYSSHVPRDMRAPLPRRGERCNDGRVWSPVM